MTEFTFAHGLLVALVLLFCLQNQQILAQPLVILLLAVPVMLSVVHIVMATRGFVRPRRAPRQIGNAVCRDTLI
jgi:ACR3 family arsenite efflux pump ArsB